MSLTKIGKLLGFNKPTVQNQEETPMEKETSIKDQARKIYCEIEYGGVEPTEINPVWVEWLNNKATEHDQAAESMSGTGMYDAIQGHHKEAKELRQAASQGTVSPSAYYKKNWVKGVARKLMDVDEDIAKTTAYHLLCLKKEIKEAESLLMDKKEIDARGIDWEVEQICRAIKSKKDLQSKFISYMEKVMDLKNQGL